MTLTVEDSVSLSLCSTPLSFSKRQSIFEGAIEGALKGGDTVQGKGHLRHRDRRRERERGRARAEGIPAAESGHGHHRQAAATSTTTPGTQFNRKCFGMSFS